MNPRLLCVALLSCSSLAGASEITSWDGFALIETTEGVFGVRRDAFDPAYERQRAQGATGRVHLPLYALVADASSADLSSALPVAARAHGCLRIYPRSASGPTTPAMALRLAPGDDSADISAALRARRPGALDTPGVATVDGLYRSRASWDRRLSVTFTGEVPDFCAHLSAMDAFTPRDRALANALRETDAPAYAAMMAAAPAERRAGLDAFARRYAAGAVELRMDDNGRPDAFASLHPVEVAVLTEMPGQESIELLRRLSAVRDEASARAILGEVRRSVAAFVSSDGQPGALATLRQAAARINAAPMDETNGTWAFDGATPAVGAVAAPAGGPAVAAPAAAESLINARPGAGGAVVSGRVEAPPGPDQPREASGPGLKEALPYAAAGAGALGGILIGLAAGGPIGAIVVGVFGGVGGFGLGKLLGSLF
ncbi:MAG: hypothetical protein SF051_15270 [Elusimicrobiota bacterium]|nr:hypothetical protein [Elusimicrobiota bacterium]